MKKASTILTFLFISVFIYSQTDTTRIEKLEQKLEKLENELSVQKGDKIKSDSIRLAEIDSISNEKLGVILKVLKDDLDTSIIIGQIFLTNEAKQDSIRVSGRYIDAFEKSISRERKREYEDDENYISFSKIRRKNRHLYKKVNDSVKIETVKISISNNAINSITIYSTEGHEFKNGFSPINLNRINNGGDILRCRKDRVTYSIDLSDIIQFDETVRYFPEDISFLLTSIDSSKPLTKAVGLNSLVNLRLFTDALGLLGEESNGLAQTELDFTIPLHRRNVSNHYAYWFSDVRMKSTFSRLDSKYKYTAVDTLTNSLQRSILNQRKWFNAEIGLVFFKGNFTKRSENYFRLDLVAGLNLSRIANNGDSLNYILPYFGLSPKLHLASSSNFGIDMYLPIYSELFPAKQTESYGEPRWLFSPNFELYYNTFGNKSSRIFARLGYTTLLQTRGDYFTLQFGYNISISEKIKEKLK
ncbi:hypothetical protein [Brumimicrobium oceani]|uniref:Uncharacterized protein n=1 Tax=Brumimicrobium oceani TaxID=2100725 RepID=A0A2U2XCH7_9FLAO|nr:hypothetical protein [Brumimicrobium oceani]PWH85411.1 hypothetical protein DIT68_09120 [Brumimicrobium oceani]